MQYPYELLAYVVRVSFRDAFGLDAVFESYQRIRVLAPALYCATHHVWGRGDQLKSLVSVGGQLAHVAEVDGKKVLVSTLERPVGRGDEVELYSTRHIHHGFKERREGWEYMAFNPTTNARIAVSFPIGREPQGLHVGASRGAQAPFVSRPGTKELIMTVKSPPLGALYRIDWSW